MSEFSNRAICNGFFWLDCMNMILQEISIKTFDEWKMKIPYQSKLLTFSGKKLDHRKEEVHHPHKLKKSLASKCSTVKRWGDRRGNYTGAIKWGCFSIERVIV